MRLIPFLPPAVVVAALLAIGCSYVARPPGNLEATKAVPRLQADALDQNAASGPLEASVEDTYVYLEFPGFGSPADEYKRLDFSVRVRNTGETPLEVRVEEMYLSFDPQVVGRPLGELDISVVGSPERLLGANRFVVPPQGASLVRIQGDRWFRDEEAGPTVYLTLILRSGENTVAVRDGATMFIAR